LNHSAANISALVKERDMIVCVGTGGVGKTTLAAALALGAAHHGQRALVVTIDPARRLADALGIDDLANEPREITVEPSEDGPIPGQLFAMMLDTKQTFDDMVARFSESPEAKERILSNPIYQHLSSALAGSAEYAAMEKVFELHESAKFDIIIVDTPPSQHALDFIDTPRRLAGFRKSRLVQLLIRPALGVGGFGPQSDAPLAGWRPTSRKAPGARRSSGSRTPAWERPWLGWRPGSQGGNRDGEGVRFYREAGPPDNKSAPRASAAARALREMYFRIRAGGP
jgi:anion-transporting  ArsA/GET3 family ATPase